MKTKTETTLSSVLTFGLSQFLAGLILVIGLLNHAYGLVYLMLLILITVNGARLWSRLSLHRLQMESHIEQHHLFAGEELRRTVRVINAKTLPVRIKLRMPMPNLYKDEKTTTDWSKTCDLLWYQEVKWEPAFTVEKRGIYEIPPVTIEGIDLLGFFTRTCLFPGASERLVVYPRLVPVKDFYIPTTEFFGSKIQRSPVEDPLFLVGTTDYRQGRPSKNIHWKASARHHRLQEKLFESTCQTKVLIMINTAEFAKANAADRWERTLEVAASLAVQLSGRGIAIGLVTDGQIAVGCHPVIPVEKNLQNPETLLESLAGLEFKTAGDLTEIIRDHAFGSATTAVYFTYAPVETDLVLQTILQQEHHLAMMSVFACEAPEIPALSGSYFLEDLWLEEKTADDRQK